MSPAALRARLRSNPLGAALLGLASLLYGLAWAAREILYALRLLPSHRLGVRVVCIGNLSAGGTGKTPAVLLAARSLHRKKVRAAILTRGYGRKAKGTCVLADGRPEPPWEETGDEPWMLRRALDGLSVPILVSRDRRLSGERAIREFGAQTLLLDDGFQHRRLRRDADIVLLDALNPFGGGRLLPLGDLREPLRALRRCHLVVLTHADQVAPERLKEIEAVLRRVRPDLPCAHSEHRAEFVLDLKSRERHRPACLKDRKIACLSGIGAPASFEEQLRRLGAGLEQVWRFPDHHPYSEEDLRSIESLRGELPLVTTFKDFPRLGKAWSERLSGEVLALGVELHITRGKAAWEAALDP